jgi:hypothetical protein
MAKPVRLAAEGLVAIHHKEGRQGVNESAPDEAIRSHTGWNFDA